MGEAIDRGRVLGETAAASERIAPGHTSTAELDEHLARYRWAATSISETDGVLDVASGVGYGAEVLRRAGAAKVVSVDMSVDALDFGRDRYGLLAARSDATCLPFPDDSFDVAVSLETIEHLPDPPALLAEIRRVLIPGGRLMLSCPNLDRSKRNNPYHLNEMTYSQLESALVGGGFHLDQVFGQHWDVLWGLLWRVPRVRRLARWIDRRSVVRSSPTPGGTPFVFCIEATAT